ncbi:MAG TPA: hypothetical protein VFW45_09955 [Candidatus Polarisedimenticolia bacterium]|nr:hypothetical protein [Candidatus Polarisedimenticolia bacterium]
MYNSLPMRAPLPVMAALLLFCLSSYSLAQEPNSTAQESPLPDGKQLEIDSAHIGKILVNSKDIFDTSDPKESYWPYRLANKLHIVTREDVVRRELLFREVDLYRQDLIDESERNLRSLGVIYHVKIRPVAYHDGIVDLEVGTQDTWTLRPSVRFSRAGGDNTWGFSFSEQNLVGRLKLLMISRKSDVDRTTTALQYFDPRLLGSRYAMRAIYAESSDGNTTGLSFSRPFFSLDTRWAANTSWLDLTQVSKLYTDGEVSSEFNQDSETFGFSYGVSTGLIGNRVARFTFGYSYERDDFSRDPDQEGFGTLPVPEDQKFSGPIFTLETLRTRYIKVTNYSQFDREEDFNLGNDFTASAWLSLRDFGAARSEVILHFGDSVGIPLSHSANFFYAGMLSGRVGSGEASNVILSQILETYWRATLRQTFYARLGMDVGIDLDEQTQFLLGGDTGLRGYPTRQFSGDRRLLLTLEHRFFSNVELLRLVRLGAAGFFDIGNAWYGSSQRVSDLHPDVGVGLRFAVSRSSVATIGRLDLAYSIDAEETDSPKLQLLFGTALKF